MHIFVAVLQILTGKDKHLQINKHWADYTEMIKFVLIWTMFFTSLLENKVLGQESLLKKCCSFCAKSSLFSLFLDNLLLEKTKQKATQTTTTFSALSYWISMRSKYVTEVFSHVKMIQSFLGYIYFKAAVPWHQVTSLRSCKCKW